MANPRTRRIGDAENAFIVPDDETEGSSRTISGVGMVGSDYSANIEDRRSDKKPAAVESGDHLRVDPPEGLSVPNATEMAPRLKAQHEEGFKMEMDDSRGQRETFMEFQEDHPLSKKKEKRR